MSSDMAAGRSPLSSPAAKLRFWRRVSLRRQLLYGFAIPVVILLLASAYVGRALDDMRLGASAATQSTEAMGLRYVMLNSMLDAETGLRGYLLSGDEEFLNPYRGAFPAMADAVRRLEVTDAPEPGHLRRIHAARDLLLRWQREFATPLIALRRSTPVGAAEELRQIAGSLETLPAGAEPAVRTRLQALITRFPEGARADHLTALSERLGTDPGSRAQVGEALLGLAGELQADLTRIGTIVQTKRGKLMVDQLREMIRISVEEEVIEQGEDAEQAAESAARARWIALLAPAGALLVGLLLALLLLLDGIRAIGATTKAAAAVAGGDLDKRVRVLREDELGELGRTFNRMASELADRRRRAEALDRFQALLGTSDTVDELYRAVGHVCAQLFPRAGGAIFRLAPSRDLAERMHAWRWPEDAQAGLDPEECRAVRGGRVYLALAGAIEVPCRHTARLPAPVGTSLCLPLTAHGETFGILQLCVFGEEAVVPSEQNLASARLVGEQLSLALASLELREKLRHQSIRDPLTGLFNRRYLEETLARELARCVRNGQPMSAAVVDVDHFKQFNDTHGHEAGDRVLVEVAALLQHGIRATDIACRHGGEEFVLLMPDSPIEAALARVDALRELAAQLQLRYTSGPLQPVTFSAGIAVAPRDGTSAETLLRAADAALYEAKSGGRNRVVAYQPA